MGELAVGGGRVQDWAREVHGGDGGIHFGLSARDRGGRMSKTLAVPNLARSSAGKGNEP